MTRYRLSVKAAEDLAEIADYTISEFGAEQARRYRDRIEKTCTIIGETPDIGRLIDAVAPPMRFFPCGSHILVYTHDQDGVLVVRIRHQREDWKDDPAE